MKRILSLALALVLLAGCAPAAPTATPTPKPVTELTIAMGFIPNVQFAPMYVALDKGYFTAEGLRVTLDYGMETDLLQLVGSGQRQFAIGSGDQVVLARAGGLPVRYVANWYKRFPVCVVSMASKGIATPADLKAKTVGIPALAGASYIGWQAFLQEVGIAKEDVNLQVIGYTQVASLTEGRVDAAISYAMNEPVQLKASGYDVNVFYLDRYADLVSNGIITNEQTIKDNPELVRQVVRAFLKGLADTIANPDEAFAAVRKAIPEMNDDAAKLQRAVLAESIEFWRSEAPGQSSAASWQATVAFMKAQGLLAADVNPADCYSNEFIK